MPYLAATTERFPLPSNPSYYVELKTRLSRGDRIAANNALLRDAAMHHGLSAENLDANLQLHGDEPVLLSRAIVAWNVDDEQGAVLPITPETVLRLTDEDAQAVLERLRELNPQRSREEQKNSS